MQAFLAVVRQGTVHGAAEDLRLTQTGVTQRVRSLEKELETTLFLRSRKGMTLTKEGEALLRYCQGAEDLEGMAMSQITRAGTDKPIHVTLVGPTSVMTARITGLCSPLYARWPQLYLHFLICDLPDRISLVRSGQATLAIVPPAQVPNEMDSKKLKPDKYVLVASPKWKGRRLSEILEQERVIDFSDSDPTTQNYLRSFQLKAVRPRLFVNNNEAIIWLFKKGVGFGTLTQEIARSHLDTGTLITLNGGAVMEDPLALAWYPRPQMPGYLQEIIQAVK